MRPFQAAIVYPIPSVRNPEGQEDETSFSQIYPNPCSRFVAQRGDEANQRNSSLYESMKVAVITPYYKEPLEKLVRCHESVLAQGDGCTHFMIADGHPNPQVPSWTCRHIVLPSAHDDNGNTPRGIGSLCAMNEGFDLICYLDADNWYAEDHISSIIYTQLATQANVVFSYRFVVFPDGVVLDAEEPEDLSHQHVDTSCMAIFSTAFRSLAGWCQMPKPLSPICDRVMFRLLTSEFQCAWTEYKSVYFETWYAFHYRLAGKPIPKAARQAKRLSPDQLPEINEQYKMRSYRPCLMG